MRINAIICEFNPIHKGHLFLIQNARKICKEDELLIGIMSGNFLERGTPAVYDKYARARAAVYCGFDAVFELPFPWSCAGAESFGMAGVYLAASLGADRLFFGSESGDISLIEKAAFVKSHKKFHETSAEAEKRMRDKGSAAVFDEAMRQNGIEDLLFANDKLGCEYVRFGKKFGILDFVAVKRDASAKSAGELRKMIFSSSIASCKDHIPNRAYELFSNLIPLSEDKYNDILFNHCRLYVRENEKNELLRYAASIAAKTKNGEEFIKDLPTKKYTRARMRREILYSILGIAHGEISEPPGYTLLLACGKHGREYLSEVRKKVIFPIITKPADFDRLNYNAVTQYKFLLSSDRLYALCAGERADEYMKKHPFIID